MKWNRGHTNMYGHNALLLLVINISRRFVTSIQGSVVHLTGGDRLALCCLIQSDTLNSSSKSKI